MLCPIQHYRSCLSGNLFINGYPPVCSDKSVCKCKPVDCCQLCEIHDKIRLNVFLNISFSFLKLFCSVNHFDILSTIPHDLSITGISVKHKKTFGGFIFDRPVARCKMNYSGHRTTGTFEADFIEEGVFGFPQFIPVESGITLKFDYGTSGAYAIAVKNLMSSNKKENPNG